MKTPRKPEVSFYRINSWEIHLFLWFFSENVALLQWICVVMASWKQSVYHQEVAFWIVQTHYCWKIENNTLFFLNQIVNNQGYLWCHLTEQFCNITYAQDPVVLVEQEALANRYPRKVIEQTQEGEKGLCVSQDTCVCMRVCVQETFHSRPVGQMAADPCPSHIPSWPDMADLSPWVTFTTPAST